MDCGLDFMGAPQPQLKVRFEISHRQVGAPRKSAQRKKTLTPENPAPFLSTTAALEQDQAEATSAFKFALKGCLIQIPSTGTASELSRTGRKQA